MLFQGGLVHRPLHRDVDLYVEVPRAAQGAAPGGRLAREVVVGVARVDREPRGVDDGIIDVHEPRRRLLAQLAPAAAMGGGAFLGHGARGGGYRRGVGYRWRLPAGLRFRLGPCIAPGGCGLGRSAGSGRTGFGPRGACGPRRHEDRCRELRLREADALGAEVASGVLQAGDAGRVPGQRHERLGDHVHRQGDREAQGIAIDPIDPVHAPVEEVVEPVPKVLLEQGAGKYPGAEEGQDLFPRARRAQALFLEGRPVRRLGPLVDSDVDEPGRFQEAHDLLRALPGDTLEAVAALTARCGFGELGRGADAAGQRQHVRIGQMVHAGVARLQQEDLVAALQARVEAVALRRREPAGGQHVAGRLAVQGFECLAGRGRVLEHHAVPGVAEHVLLPDAHQLRAGALVVELDGFQLDLGVLVLFRVEEEAPLAFVEVRSEPGEGVHPGVQAVGVRAGRGDVADEVVAAESPCATAGNDAGQQHRRCNGLGEGLPGQVALVRRRTVDQRAGGVEVLQAIRAGAVGDLAVRRAHQGAAAVPAVVPTAVPTAVHGVQHGAEQPQGAACALEAAALRDALEDQLDQVGEERKGAFHPFEVGSRRLDAELSPRVHVGADDGACRIAIAGVRVGEQAVPHDGGAIVGVAEAQLDAGGAFQRRAGLPAAVVHRREQRDPASPVGLLAQHLQEAQVLLLPGRVADAADAAFQLVEDQDHVPVAEVRAQRVQVRWPFTGPVGAERLRDQQPQGIAGERPVGQLPDHQQRVVGRRPVVAERPCPPPGGPRA